MTVFPNGKHDDQVDSTAQFLDWFKKPFPGQGIFELYRREAEKLKPPKPVYVRIKAPPGISAVQTFSGRHIPRSARTASSRCPKRMPIA